MCVNTTISEQIQVHSEQGHTNHTEMTVAVQNLLVRSQNPIIFSPRKKGADVSLQQQLPELQQQSPSGIRQEAVLGQGVTKRGGGPVGTWSLPSKASGRFLNNLQVSTS